MINLYDAHTNYNLKDIVDYIVLDLGDSQCIISNELLCLFYQMHANNNILFYETLPTELMILPDIKDSKITLYFKSGLKGNMWIDIAHLNLNIFKYNGGMGGKTYWS